MKRSKMFLGLTTAVLAIVGVAAAKAHKFTTKHFGFYSNGANQCTLGTTVSWYTSGTTTALTAGVNPGTQVPVYTAYSTGACSTNTLYSNHNSAD